jgi:deoxyribodipyrimidine photo-lyase
MSGSNDHKIQVVWFKRDLRIEDHRPLIYAAQNGPVLPVFIAEPDLWGSQPDMSGRQWAFVRESLKELSASLAGLGQPLVCKVGRVIDVLDQIQKTFVIQRLWSHEETGNAWTYQRDLAVAAWCRENGVPWAEIPQFGVIRRLKSRDGWSRRWDRFMAEEAISPPAALKPITSEASPATPSPSDLLLATDFCPHRQQGGSSVAKDLLESFLDRRGRTYRSAISSPATGANACSRLSPHLAWGTISLRHVAQATWAKQRSLAGPSDSNKPAAQADWRNSLKSFNGRLHWHCHFIQKLEDAPGLEFENLHRAYDGLRPAEPDRLRLVAWANGETGLPFVDACMRCLRQTGWLNFRMRAMLMAVASYHLWLPWRASGEVVARYFTDYEPGIHWPQVQMQSGTTGVNTVRIYNPVKQGFDQDPTGAFTRQWLPELSSIPDRYLQEPWLAPESGAVLGKTYPSPIVDHLEAAKAARAAVWGVRKGSDFRRQAASIQDRHGSRRSPRRQTRTPARKRNRPTENDKLEV